MYGEIRGEIPVFRVNTYGKQIAKSTKRLYLIFLGPFLVAVY